jgi:hypothetical protein
MKINKLKYSFIILLCQLSIIYTAYYLFTKPTDHYKYYRNISLIKEDMKKAVKSCGEGYFMSWLVMKSTNLKNKFMFEEVLGCNKDMSNNCVFSVKQFNLNTFYNKSDHVIDRKTYNFLLSIPNAEVAYFDNIESLNKYDTIKYINDNTNLQIKQLAFSVIKNKKDDLIYVFSLSNTNNQEICARKKVVLLLKELSQKAKNKFY